MPNSWEEEREIMWKLLVTIEGKLEADARNVMFTYARDMLKTSLT